MSVSSVRTALTPVPKAAAEAPRVTPGSRSELGVVTWGVVRLLGVAARTGPPNLFATLAKKNRRLLFGWLAFASRLMPFGTLPRRESELVILRVAHLRDCRYEFEHHVRLGAKVGLGDADITRVKEGPEAEGFSDRERALLRVVDAIHATRDVPDALWAELGEWLDEAKRVELVMLVGHYEMLATAIGVLRIAPDAPLR
jgi:AhpD family alkylhydroperoxidase